jgi:hypothetical protein
MSEPNETTHMPPDENHRMVMLVSVPGGRIEITIPAPFGSTHPTTVSQLEKFFPLFLDVCKEAIKSPHPALPRPQPIEGESEHAP